MTQPYIRRAGQSDSPSLSRICLLTADAGESAERLHVLGELPGLVWAEPYVNVPSAVGFVLVDPSLKPDAQGDHNAGDKGLDSKGEVVGYILSAFDTRSYEREVEQAWFPQWRARYPNPDHAPNEAHSTETADRKPKSELKEVDITYIRLIHDPPIAAQSVLEFSPAHMHIDILPAYQNQGWGRRLIGRLVEYLRDEKSLNGVWLGMDMRNVKARMFYEHLGFKSVEGAPSHIMALRFHDWGEK